MASRDPDFVANPDQQVLYKRLRQSYHKKGCRFMHLLEAFEVDNLDWPRLGVYEVVITTDMSDATVVTIRNKLSGSTAVLPSGLAHHDHAYTGTLAPLTSESAARPRHCDAHVACDCIRGEIVAPSRVRLAGSGAMAGQHKEIQSIRSSKVGSRVLSTRTASTGSPT